MPPRSKKKKGKAAKLVAPEPIGDEWESNYQWDRVSAHGGRQDFMVGGYTAATEQLFPVKFDVTEAAPRDLHDERPHFQLRRATDAFYEAEEKLKALKRSQDEAASTVCDFQSLQEVEKMEMAVERAVFDLEAAAMLAEMDATECQLDKEVSQTSERFFIEQKNVLNRLFDLVSHDWEIEDAFNERVATLAECERVTEAYYKEHGEHVVNMEKMQLETAHEHESTLQEMTETLQRTALEFMSTTSALNDTDEHVEKNRTMLILELQRLQQDSDTALSRNREVLKGSTYLKRLVELEKQKLSLAADRNARLKTGIAGLNHQVSSQVVPRGQPTVGVTQRSILSSEATNKLTELRRQIDAIASDLAAAQGKVDQLRHHHLIQLSGQYRLVNLSADALKTTHNYLDPETNAAVRHTVVAAMIEVSKALGVLEQGVEGADGSCNAIVSTNNTSSNNADPLRNIAAVNTLADRKAVQNFVVSRINKLFTCRCPTAPSLANLEMRELSV